jgi:DNA-binding CsgD family transcriptional regulator
LRAAEGLAFVARCGAAGELAAMIADFRHTVARFGFAVSACGGWVGVGKQRTSRFFFIDWPQDWIDLYTAQNFFAHDFVVAEARVRLTPFAWEEVRAGRKLTTAEQNVYDAARRYGWREVFAVPIHGPFGYQALVTMAAKQLCPLSAAERAALQMMAFAIHDRCRTAAGAGDTGRQTHELSERERECLQWAAAGKTDAEIGKLIGVSAATAHFHIERAKKKLGVRSRAEAIARLVLRGEI